MFENSSALCKASTRSAANSTQSTVFDERKVEKPNNFRVDSHAYLDPQIVTYSVNKNENLSLAATPEASF
jgi:hypothetical protein